MVPVTVESSLRRSVDWDAEGLVVVGMVVKDLVMRARTASVGAKSREPDILLANLWAVIETKGAQGRLAALGGTVLGRRRARVVKLLWNVLTMVLCLYGKAA